MPTKNSQLYPHTKSVSEILFFLIHTFTQTETLHCHTQFPITKGFNFINILQLFTLSPLTESAIQDILTRNLTTIYFQIGFHDAHLFYFLCYLGLK